MTDKINLDSAPLPELRTEERWRLVERIGMLFLSVIILVVPSPPAAFVVMGATVFGASWWTTTRHKQIRAAIERRIEKNDSETGLNI